MGLSVLTMIFLALFGLGSFASAQPGPALSGALPMVEAQGCPIGFSTMGLQGRWGGQIAVYQATTDSAGSIITLERRIIEGREHLPPLVKLDQFEDCIRRWRFEDQAQYEISLFGGTTFEGVWVIQVRKDT